MGKRVEVGSQTRGKVLHSGKKTRDIFPRMTEQTGEYEPMDPYRTTMQEQCGDATEGK
jgi:hypothetical protein